VHENESKRGDAFHATKRSIFDNFTFSKKDLDSISSDLSLIRSGAIFRFGKSKSPGRSEQFRSSVFRIEPVDQVSAESAIDGQLQPHLDGQRKTAQIDALRMGLSQMCSDFSLEQ
jgi:hypothetical protein